MKNTSISSIYLNSQTALPKEYSNLLKEGSSVLVRILKQNSSNSYTASFAGGRFSIKSSLPLTVGSKFMARVSFLDGKLNLILQENEKLSSLSSAAEQKINFTSTSSLLPEFSQLLLSLGLPLDNVSKMLIQSTVNFGVKLNLEKIKKARLAASQFPGREEEASEAALILIEKGIAPTKKNLLQILSSFDLENNLEENILSRDFDEFQLEQNRDKNNINIEEIKSEIENYFNKIFSPFKNSIENFDKNLNAENENISIQKAGFLTIFNHLVATENLKEKNFRAPLCCDLDKSADFDINSSGQKTEKLKSHWVILPFTFEFSKMKNFYSGNGIFRIFFDLEKNNIKKIVINFEIASNIWNFVVKFESEKIENIKFCCLDFENRSNKIQLEEKSTNENFIEKEKILSKMFDGVFVQYEIPENLIGFSSKIERLAFVKGFA